MFSNILSFLSSRNISDQASTVLHKRSKSDEIFLGRQPSQDVKIFSDVSGKKSVPKIRGKKNFTYWRGSLSEEISFNSIAAEAERF